MAVRQSAVSSVGTSLFKEIAANGAHREPGNQGKSVGQKTLFQVKDTGALRVRFQSEGRVRALALFNQGIDSQLCGCDFLNLQVRDVCCGDQAAGANPGAPGR